MNTYFGIVEAINDPKQLGRVRVRVFGIHTHDKNAIPTETLPWASVVQPTTSAANSGIGQNPRLLIGSLVMLVFADPDDMQIPIVTGSVPSEIKETVLEINGVKLKRNPDTDGFQDPDGNYPKYLDGNDLPLSAKNRTYETHHSYTTRRSGRLEDDNTTEIVYPTATAARVPTVAEDKADAYYANANWVEPPPANNRKPVYPKNQVRVSESGITEEWDDSVPNGRIHTFHPSGTYQEVINDGSKTIKVVGKNHEIYLDGSNIFINGNVNLTIDGDKKELVTGNYTLEVEGEVNYNFHSSEQKKVGYNIETEIGQNRTTNISKNDLTFTSGNTTETTIQDRIRVVNGMYSSSITKEANYMYQNNVTTSISGEQETSVISNVKTVIGGNENHMVVQNQTIGVKKNVSETIGQNQTVNVAQNVSETVGGNQTTQITGNLNVDAARIDLN